MSMFGELGRRNVIRVGVAYLIVAWVVTQVADLVLENIGAPNWVIQAIMLVVALGFPVVLFFSWAYEVTPEGIKRESDIDRSQSITDVTGRRLDRAISVLLVIALAYFVWESREAVSPETPPPLNGNINETSTAAAAVSALSIAVLPFENRSNREEDEFFTAGMHDDLLTTIAKIGSLKVISRTSVMEYRNTTKKLPEIARELGVANILEGGIQRSGNHVRINMQLIDAKTDEHLWAEIYDRELTAENLFAIQSEISREIAAALQATLSPDEQRRIDTAPTNNLDAHEAYMRGRLLMATREATRLEESLAEFRRAVEIDPRFALAWVGVADALSLLANYGSLSNSDTVAERSNAIDKAFAIDANLGEAYASLGSLFEDQGNPARAEGALRQAIELSPNYATGYHWLANFLRDDILRLDQALEYGRKSVELDPRSTIIGANLSGIYSSLGDYNSAVQEARRVLRIDPGFAAGHRTLAGAYATIGELDKAVDSLLAATSFDAGGLISPGLLINVYVALGAIDAATAAHDTLRNTAPDHPATVWTKLILAAAANNTEDLRDAAQLLQKTDLGSYLSAETATAYLLLGDNGLAQDSIVRANPALDLRKPASWPPLIRTNPRAACMLAWTLLQTGEPEVGKALLNETLRYFEELFPKVVRDVDAYGPDLCYLAAGDNDKALDVIELQFEHGHFAGWNVGHLLALYDPIRSDPRYLSIYGQYERRITVLREAAGL